MSRAAAVVLVSLAAGVACQHHSPEVAHEPATGSVAAPSADEYETRVRPFVAAHCLPCHDALGASGGLSFDPDATEADALSEPHVWREVRERLRLGEMPPPGQPRPNAADTAAVLAWIDAALAPDADGTAAGPVDPGRVTLRRLNRTEYRNTVRDLVGVDFDSVAALPDDEVGYGFDNVGDVLSLPPVLLEKYLDAAEEIAARAIVAEDPENPPVVRFEAEDVERAGRIHVSGGFVGMFTEGAVHTTVRFPRDGEYLLRARAFADQAGPDLAQMDVRIDGERIAAVAVRSTRADPGLFEKRVRVTRGAHTVAAAFVNDYYHPQHPDPSKRDRNLWVDYLEIVGPVDAYPDELPESHRRVFFRPVREESRVADTRAVLERLASRAFRRPASRQEIDALVALVEDVRSGGGRAGSGRTEEGVQLALQAVLVSPHFLFRVEADGAADTGDGVRVLSEHELATRLSYFLWSSMPDERLFAAAAAGTLSADLDAQVRRMLADPRAGTLASNFAEQWLQLRRLRRHEPDAEAFPDFDPVLRDAMLAETLMLVDHVIQQDADVHLLLDAPFTFLNERLARHYGVSGVTGERFRKVALHDPRRAGVLTHASVLTLTSHPGRTSPVRRGKWILEQILASPPPPPPPEVPALPEDDGEHAGLSLRERLKRHRVDPTCVTCHAPMDPLGFGLENFDAVGRWRERDGGAPVDASGELPSGRAFEGPAELRAVIRADGRFTRAVAEKLFVYSLGRGLTASDAPAIERIRRAAAEEGHRFSAFVRGVVRSDAFRKRRVGAADGGTR